ncbi:MAG: arginine--tRNA ligase [Lachnospiraceae bacterium]|nr:arginine--tRNA ligase [Lachnospiraceae bacterium]MDY5742115.1 arginine--tRNA ligase [Lachnospiraceae bacterium]
MKRFISRLQGELEQAFVKAGYEAQYGRVSLSNRPDLCEFQCNGAMACAKQYKKAPIVIANEVLAQLEGSSVFASLEAVMPGFINIKAAEAEVAAYLQEMEQDEELSLEKAAEPETIVIDFGGANVAKPLHVGHLRSAIIGEAVKRIARRKGHRVIGDAHLGDWGLQMGLIISWLEQEKPQLPYFTAAAAGSYPQEAPFTIDELERIYPQASALSKEETDEGRAFREKALTATALLQDGHPGYRALWQHIINVSIADLKKNYDRLNVDFDWWKKESDAQKYIPDMVTYLKDNGYARYDQGALVVDVKEETDTKEIPPCMILKSNGSSLYNTTDLATMIERRELVDPDRIIYVVDKRQSLYFEQVFRAAKKTKILDSKTDLFFLGFGTMNGKDGKPFKTRAGGVMRLENLISEINEAMLAKINENRQLPEAEALRTAEQIGLAAVKYGDLSNQASKDYIFDVERFTSFEGNTGPYILYTMVRIKSILTKYDGPHTAVAAATGDSEKALQLVLTRFNEMLDTAYEELAPHKICAYIYELANAFNKYYHETKILGEPDEAVRASRIALLQLTLRVFELCIDTLGFEAPERM